MNGADVLNQTYAYSANELNGQI